jgi:hypothetical protein
MTLPTIGRTREPLPPLFVLRCGWGPLGHCGSSRGLHKYPLGAFGHDGR